MEIYLIRHTTPDIEKGICYGQSDIDLKDNFEQEIKDTLHQIPSQFDLVYSSPLKRCLKLAKRIQKDILIDDRLIELNFGDWELKKWDDIPNHEIEPWYEDWVNTPPKNGESYFQMHERTQRFIKELPKKERIAIVTHSGTIRRIIAHFKNIDLKDSFDKIESVPYGGI